MSRITKHAPSKKPPVKTEEESATRSGAIAHPFESFMMAVTSAQFAYLEAMNQCALAWLNVASGEPVSTPKSDETARAKPALRNGTVRAGSHALVRSADWLSVPVITGIEETFNDHLTKPRFVTTAARPDEADVLTLWKRSNEFETSHLAAQSGRPDAGHHEVA